MANTTQQLSEMDNLLDGLDGLDELDALDFEAEEVEAETDENEMLEAAQSDLAEEETVEEDLDALLTDDGEEADEEALDALLADESDEKAVEEEQEEPDMEAIEADMKAEERQKRLDEATMTDEEADEAKAALTADPSVKLSDEAKAKVAESKPKSTPKEAIDCADVLTSKVNPTRSHWELLSGVDPDELRITILSDAESLPKKTREKVVNLMDWWVRGANLSVYTKIGLELLIEEGEITGTSLRNRYMSNPGKAYTMGTANAQSGQIIKLFKTFKITTSDGQIDPDHEMVKRFGDITHAA